MFVRRFAPHDEPFGVDGLGGGSGKADDVEPAGQPHLPAHGLPHDGHASTAVRRTHRRDRPVAGHESPTTTHQYTQANLAMKEKALAKLQDPDTAAKRFRATDSLLESGVPEDAVIMRRARARQWPRVRGNLRAHKTRTSHHWALLIMAVTVNSRRIRAAAPQVGGCCTAALSTVSFLSPPRTHTGGHNRALVIRSEFPLLARLG